MLPPPSREPKGRTNSFENSGYIWGGGILGRSRSPIEEHRLIIMKTGSSPVVSEIL
jgi:hypothetical protein